MGEPMHFEPGIEVVWGIGMGLFITWGCIAIVFGEDWVSKGIALLREVLGTFYGGFPVTWDEDCAAAAEDTKSDD